MNIFKKQQLLLKISIIFCLGIIINGCVVENGKSLSCGAKDKSAEKSCCSGLVCHKVQTWKCVKEENMWCGGRGTVAKECGSNRRKAEASCCSGLVCDYSTKKCI